MKTKKLLKRSTKQLVAIVAILMLMMSSITTLANETDNPVEMTTQKTQLSPYRRYVTIQGNQMQVTMYGNLQDNNGEISFKNKEKTTLVLLPALGVVSTNIYMKPLAEALQDQFNVLIVDPFGYGLSDSVQTPRTTRQINKELNELLEKMDIAKCVLVPHSISGIYALEFATDYPGKVEGVIAIETTVYQEDLLEQLALEKAYMLEGMKAFNEMRNSFPSLEAFKQEVSNNAEEYGAIPPTIIKAVKEVNGEKVNEYYEYLEKDKKEYIEAYVKGCNQSIISEINCLENNVKHTEGYKYSDTLPVLTLLASANVERNPGWEPGHREQLNLASGKHVLEVLEGDHYLWYYDCNAVVKKIKAWWPMIKN